MSIILRPLGLVVSLNVTQYTLAGAANGLLCPVVMRRLGALFAKAKADE